jgi:hypothetical protein
MLRPSGLTNFNWAYVILPISACTCVWLTLFLPWRLHCVIRAEIPKVDPWTELGEKRRDLTGEYERLLDADESPYSFLYRGALDVGAGRSERP